jgi:hypothetical protein
MIVRRLSVACSAAIGAMVFLRGLAAEPASAANWLELDFYLRGPQYEGVLPPCDYPDALLKIRERFRNKENEFWHTHLNILMFENIRETAFRPWAVNTIPRRFCRATVEISDGSKRPIYYSIAEDAGMIGATWGVEWCVGGLDRNWAYNYTYNQSCLLATPDP